MTKQQSAIEELKTAAGLEGLVENRVSSPSDAKDLFSTSLEVVVDPTPQKLRDMFPFLHAREPAPSSLPQCAQFALNCLLDCFRKQGFVKEGLCKDFLWGVGVSYPERTEEAAFGLVDLKREGYISFMTPDGVEADEHCTNLSECWMRYNKKLLDHVFKG
jgi:hypothetical protein